MLNRSKLFSALLLGLLIAGCGGGGGGGAVAANGPGGGGSEAKPFMGIRVQSSGQSPFAVQSATNNAKALAGQCVQLNAVCALLPAGNSEPVCQNLPKEFTLKGNLADVGKEEVKEYFATGERMQTTRIQSNVFVSTGPCGAEVKEVESVKIRQFTASGWTDYERKEDKDKARFWQRTDTPMLPDAVIAMLANLAPAAGTTVSAPTGTEVIANTQCDKYTFSGLLVGTSCIGKTETPYPGYITLATTRAPGSGGVVVLDRRATLVEKNIQLSKTDFFPPDGEPVKLIGQ